jgi:hypothetical protein
MKFKSLHYVAVGLFVLKSIGFAQENKRPALKINGQLCSLISEYSRSEKPNFFKCVENVGCLNVPKNYELLSSEEPLLYIRGLKQEPAPTTRDLFYSQYNLGKLNQIVFATASADTSLSNEDIECLKNLSKNNKINVASHSAGHIGLQKNASNLKGKVHSLFLLDNFYDPAGVKTSVSIIQPDQCSGFVTPHNQERLSSAKPDCKISYKQKEEHETAVIKTLSNSSTGNIAKSQDNSEVPLITITKTTDYVDRKPAAHGSSQSDRTSTSFSMDTTFLEYAKGLEEAEKFGLKGKSQKNKDKFSALQESVVDQYIHRSVQTLGCAQFDDTLFFNGARLASLRLKNEGNIILGDSKSVGLLSRLSHNVETWCQLSQKIEKSSSSQTCIKITYKHLKELSEYFFNFSQNHPDLDSSEKIYSKLKEEIENKDSILSKNIALLKQTLKDNNLNIRCKKEESLNPFAIKNEKANPSGKYSQKPPRDSSLKAKIIRAARETVKLSKEESLKARNGLSVNNTSRGVFGRLRDKISNLFASKEGDEIDPDILDPHNGYENARSRSLCYRYTHIALASAGLTDKWHVRPPGYAKDATRDFIPNLKKADGSPYFTEQVMFSKGSGPTVRTEAANKLMLNELNKDKQGVYVVVYDNPGNPGHIGTVFYNEDKKQWEEYSDYMAPVFGQSARSGGQSYRYGGRSTNKIKAIYKLNDDKNGERS